jgi:hypothetical protein
MLAISTPITTNVFCKQLDTIYDDTDCQWLMNVVVFPYTPVSSTNKTFGHDTTEIFIMTKHDLNSYLFKKNNYNEIFPKL